MEKNNRPDLKQRTKDWLNRYGKYVLGVLLGLCCFVSLAFMFAVDGYAMPTGGVIDEVIEYEEGLYLPSSFSYTFLDDDDGSESTGIFTFDDKYNTTPTYSRCEGYTDQILVSIETRLNDIYVDNQLYYEDAHVTIIDGIDGSLNSGYWGTYSDYVLSYRDFYVPDTGHNYIGFIVDYENLLLSEVTIAYDCVFDYYAKDGTLLHSMPFHQVWTGETDIAGRLLRNLSYNPWDYNTDSGDVAYILCRDAVLTPPAIDPLSSLTLIQYEPVELIEPVFEDTEYVELQPIYTDFNIISIITDAINGLFEVEWLGGIALGSFFGLVIAIPVMFFVFKTFLGG